MVGAFLTRFLAGSFVWSCRYKCQDTASELNRIFTHLAVLDEVDQEYFRHLVEAEGFEGIEDVIASNSLAFLACGSVCSLRSDETDELGSCLLDTLCFGGGTIRL